METLQAAPQTQPAVRGDASPAELNAYLQSEADTIKLPYLVIGLVVLVAALTEGTANDWIALAVTEGHGQPEEIGVLAFATFPALMFQAEARAAIRRDGAGVMEIGAHDMGQGAWTALAQIAADELGLDIDRVEFKAGTSDLPDAGIAGGSAHTATAGAAIHSAGMAVIAKLADLATNDERSPLFGAGNAGVIARDGRLIRRDDEGRGESYAEILARAGVAEVEARGTGAPNPAAMEEYAMHAHGAVFAEVKVDPELGQIRVTRMVGAFAAGRIVNPRMVQSQLFGGMIWGMSFALHEEAVTDRRSGRIMNANLGEYHIPVNADVPPLDVITVDEHDPHVNALGIKGVGEIGITGSAGAVANAVWHATGVRVRRFPIRIEELLTQL